MFLITNGPLLMNRFLFLVESKPVYYNLKFNYDKCHVICMNGIDDYNFKMVNLYILSKNVYISTEINGRIASAMDAISSVKTCWSFNYPLSWKLVVLESIVYSKLIYGLENLQLTTLIKRLDTFQQKYFRRILNIFPTFIDRSWTNSRVLEIASHHRPQITVSTV